MEHKTDNTKDIISARVAGYDYGLRHPVPQSDYITDGEIVMWHGSPPPDAIEKAWYRGYNDSGAPDWQDYCSPEAAASTKGVNVRTLWRILRDDKRRAEHFPQAIPEGEGGRREWHIHIEDLVKWQPSNAGRKRKEPA